MIHARLVIIVWDKVPGATGYMIFKDGVHVSSTKTVTEARLSPNAKDTLYEIVAKGVQAPRQSVTVKQVPVRL